MQLRASWVIVRPCRHRFLVRRLIPTIRHASELFAIFADQPRELLTLLDLRQRTWSPLPHCNPRTHRVLQRPLETARHFWVLGLYRRFRAGARA